MNVTALQSTGAATVEWVVPRKCRLRKIATSVSNTYVTLSPTIVAGDITAPGATGTRFDLLSPAINSSANGALTDLDIPLDAGDALYVIFAAAGTVFFYLA